MLHKYHFVGIGGIGMSALARLAVSHGGAVSGSDKVDSPALADLRACGVAAWAGHAAEHVPADAVVVTTDAIRGANPEVEIARARGQEVIRRSQLLGRMMEQHDGIAIAGTHGKTSTTAMLARVMLECGLDPTVVVGGDAFGEESNAHAGRGHHFVAEACEAYGSFEHLAPRIAVVTNIEADHLDHHGTFENLYAAFQRFTERIVPGGVLVAGADDPHAHRLAAAYGGRSVLYGIEAGEWQAESISLNGTGADYDVSHCGQKVASVALSVPGRHNVSNSLAAFVVGIELGLDADAVSRAIGTYRGVGRRFELLGEKEGVRVFDDYAHHPTEVRATLAAARAGFPGRIIAVFQPHLYSRTRDFMDDFIAAFDDADAVFVTGIYRSREEPLEGVSGASIVDGIALRSPGKPARYAPDKAEAAEAALRLARPGDVILVMGAGDIREAGEALVAGGR